MGKTKNKRGELRDYIGDVVIGVLCLLLIIFSVIIIYRVFANQEEANAKRTIDNIEAKVNALNDGEGNKFLIQGFVGAKKEGLVSDNGWFLAGWSKKEEGRPDACFFESCICICKGEILYGKSNLAAECLSKGFCRKFGDRDIKVVRNVFTLELLGTPNTGGNAPAPASFVQSKEKKLCTGIRLRENLLQISITKTKEMLQVVEDSDEAANKKQACF